MGPVEVCLHNVWHRVCDSYWTKKDATVACRQLDFPLTSEISFSHLCSVVFPTIMLGVNPYVDRLNAQLKALCNYVATLLSVHPQVSIY